MITIISKIFFENNVFQSPGERKTDSLTILIFCRVPPHLGPPEGFCSSAESVVLKFLTLSSLQFFDHSFIHL